MTRMTIRSQMISHMAAQKIENSEPNTFKCAISTPTMASSDSGILGVSKVNMRVDIADNDEVQNIINEYRGDEKSDTIAETWGARLATMSANLNGAAPVNKKKMTGKQKRRVEKYREQIAQLNVCIDALNQYFVTWFKKFEAGEIGREELVTNIDLINSTIASSERQRSVFQLELDQLNVN